jgi:hypothetical protein
MGWIISVGKAGARGNNRDGQVLSVCFDASGVAARIEVYADAGKPAGQGGAIPAWQARRIWRNVLSTLADTE